MPESNNPTLAGREAPTVGIAEIAEVDEARERKSFETHQRAKLRSHWLYNNPHGFEIVDSMLTVIPAEINGYKQNRAGQYVTQWIETKWRGWLERAIAGAPPTGAADGTKAQPTCAGPNDCIAICRDHPNCWHKRTDAPPTDEGTKADQPKGAA